MTFAKQKRKTNSKTYIMDKFVLVYPFISVIWNLYDALLNLPLIRVY